VGQQPGAPAPALTPSAEVDLRGEVCPYTFLRARLALEPLAPGAVLRILVDSPTAVRDVPRGLDGAGHAVLSVQPLGAEAWVILARRGG
jgi:TusA-related sulfurtransferase